MSKKLWGGRFNKKTNPLVEEFTKSIGYDSKLALYDVLGSIAHTQILKKAGLIKGKEAHRLSNALYAISESIRKGAFKPNKESEDIHTNIQNILQEKVGDLALKLHTARSRNDQVVFATKVYCKTELLKLQVDVVELGMALCGLAQKNKGLIMPGFTHMQHAQPVYLTDYLMAYNDMLKKDFDRIRNVISGIKITMGAGALAGTPIKAADYAIKASRFLKEKGYLGKEFDITVTTNSIYAVSDRDFIIEILSALSITGMHLSRLAEDLIIWSTKEFDFVEIDESFCTGSSLMPQKKNPDALELIRGYAGRIYGNLLSVLTMMKGLPLAYNRDMQLDKEPLFNSLEVISDELKILTGLIKTLRFKKASIEKHLKDESLYATDLVYYLVQKGAAFKNAHTIIGKLVRHSMDNGILIKNMPQSILKRFSDKFVKNEVIKLFDPQVSVDSKRSIKRSGLSKGFKKV